MDSTDGPIEGQQESNAPIVGEPLEGEQTLADGEQTLADSEQMLSDADQTGGDSDQTSSDRDQLASDNDQAASDRDLTHGVDPRAHEFSHDARERSARHREQSARQRELTAQARLAGAEKRDEIARMRDVAARARDQAAEARDLALAQLDRADEQFSEARALTDADFVVRGAGQRKRAAVLRARAAEHRVLAAQDRRAAAEDRKQAARERLRAVVDREALARQVAFAETDPLTGARARAAGLTDLEHELDRSRRTNALLVVAYVDVVGLKRVNDVQGHSAGDALLKHVVEVIKAHLRPYDLIVRVGGDEFVCVMSRMTLADARQRFKAISGPPDGCAIRAGFAQLTHGETAEELIARADSELVNGANGHHPTDLAATEQTSGM